MKKRKKGKYKQKLAGKYNIFCCGPFAVAAASRAVPSPPQCGHRNTAFTYYYRPCAAQVMTNFKSVI